MDLLLWRHAEAVEGLPDSTRELTERGVRQAHKVAEWLESRRPKKLRVLVSPMQRFMLYNRQERKQKAQPRMLL